MGKSAIAIVYILAMAATVAAMDILFFRNRFGERLMANVGIVLLYVAFYMAFLRHR